MRRHGHVNWALFDQAMISGVNFLTGILLARFLGVEEFGRYVLAWTAVLTVNSVHQALIIQPMMSIGPQQPVDRRSAYYGAVLIQQLAYSIACLLLIMVGVQLADRLFPHWRVAGFAVPLACAAFGFQLQDFLRRFYFTHGRPARAFVNDALRYLGQLAVLAWLLLNLKMDVPGVLWVIAGCAGTAVVIGFASIRGLAYDGQVLRETALRHWTSSKWLALSAIVTWVGANMFTIAAGALLGPAAAGALRAARTLMGLANIFFLGLENIIPVRAAKHYASGGGKAMVPYLWRIGLFATGCTAVIGLTAAAAPTFWLTLVYGEQYAEYGYLLPLVALAVVLRITRMPILSGLRAMEQTRPVFLSQVVAALFALSAAYFLVDTLGLIGVPLGMSTMAMIQLVWLTYTFSSRLRREAPAAPEPSRL